MKYELKWQNNHIVPTDLVVSLVGFVFSKKIKSSNSSTSQDLPQDLSTKYVFKSSLQVFYCSDCRWQFTQSENFISKK